MIYTRDDLSKVAKYILHHSSSRVYLFYGPMGVGKTTLIMEMARQLGTTELTSSPSFSIVNEYEIPKGLIYHFDFYRIEKEQEALDLGIEDYLYSGQYVFVEWPEKIKGLLPQDAVEIHLKLNKNKSRTLTVMPMN